MQRYDLRHLPVLEGEKLLGIISERDIQSAKVFVGKKFHTESIRGVVEQNFLTSQSEAITLEVISTMNKKKLDCVLVLKASKVIGIFTLSDAMRLFLNVLS